MVDTGKIADKIKESVTSITDKVKIPIPRLVFTAILLSSIWMYLNNRFPDAPLDNNETLVILFISFGIIYVIETMGRFVYRRLRRDRSSNIALSEQAKPELESVATTTSNAKREEL